MTKVIEIVVDAKGQISVQTRGFSGPECREASRSLEAALGARLTESTTAEFHRQDQAARQEIRQPE